VSGKIHSRSQCLCCTGEQERVTGSGKVGDKCADKRKYKAPAVCISVMPSAENLKKSVRYLHKLRCFATQLPSSAIYFFRPARKYDFAFIETFSSEKLTVTCTKIN
jgi:hypothetical protein